MKNKSKNNKVNKIRLKTVIGSISTIGIYLACVLVVTLVFYLIFWILLKILISTQQKNVFEFLLKILEEKNVIYFKAIVIFIFNLVFALIIKKKFVIEDVKDYLQKFIILVLTITSIGVCVNLNASKSKIYTQFLSLQVLQPLYYDLVNADHESEFYKTNYNADFIGEFSTYKDVSDGFIQKHEQAVETFIYSKTEPLFLDAILEITGMIVCIVLVKFSERNKKYKSILE